MKIKTLIFMVVATSLLNGCASIINGTSESVSVTTPPAADAHCMLTNDKGTWYVNDTPGSVTVHRAYGDMHVTCHKSGCRPATTEIKSSTKGMAFGNIIFGGLIGGGVDAADGAAYDYPQEIIVPMNCKSQRKAKV